MVLIAFGFVASPTKNLQVIKAQCQLWKEPARLYVVNIYAGVWYAPTSHTFPAIVGDDALP
jgi:hypothetical protein